MDRASSARAWGEFIRIGSSYQVRLYGSSHLASFLAMGRFHSEWNSTMISILSPTARRIFSNGSSAALSWAGVMDRPSFSMAAGSKGQIFMAPMPLSSRLSATASARFMNPSRSS